jgi:cytochrome bd-type quinol oxidase subunit 2
MDWLAMRSRQVLTATGATVIFGVALVLAVLAVAFVVAVEREYGGPDWHWWTDPTVYLILAVPLVLSLLGGWLVRRTRHGKNR